MQNKDKGNSNTNCTFKWHLVFWVTIGSNTNLHLTLINLFSVVSNGVSKSHHMYILGNLQRRWVGDNTVTIPKFQNGELLTTACWTKRVWEWHGALNHIHGVQWDRTTWTHTSTDGGLATYGVDRGTLTQSLFQSPKTTSRQQRHVEQMVEGCTRTLFHLCGCNGAGRRGGLK
jgi:hypothetical protein